MNALVYAQIVSLHAAAQLRVERLEARHRQTPNTIGKHAARLSLFREMTEAKDQAASWHYVMENALLTAEDAVDEKLIPSDDSSRIVAFTYQGRPNVMYCLEHGRGRGNMTPVTSEDLPDGGLCTWARVPGGPECGRDMLA